MNLARGGAYEPLSLAVRGDRVFFLARNTEESEQGGLFSVPASGGESVRLAIGPVTAGAHCQGVATDDAFAYFTSDTSHGKYRALRKVSLDGGEVVDLVPVGFRADCVAVDDAGVYFSSDDGLFRVDKDGGDPEEISDDDPTSLVVHGGALVYSTTTEIRALPLPSGGAVTLAGQLHSLTSVAADDAYVYATGHDDDIFRVPRAGGAPEPLVVGEDDAWGLVVGNSALYWSRRPNDPAENRLMKLPLGGAAGERDGDGNASGAIEITSTVGGTDLALGAAGLFWISDSESAVRRTSP